jgi:pimeloyl-ACP methyl ester carboxylesterase
MGDVVVRSGSARLPGVLDVGVDPSGIVVFAHGSGSSRLSPRNQTVARTLNARSFATLLFDLLTPAEARQRVNVFDIALLGSRLAGAIAWLESSEVAGLPVGLFGASTGAAAALVAAASSPDAVDAVVSRGGRPDLAGAALAAVTAPTLLIIGSEDDGVLALNRRAAAQMTGRVTLEVVPGAGHLFEEPGTLDAAAQLAGDWFLAHLTPRSRDHRP